VKDKAYPSLMLSMLYMSIPDSLNYFFNQYNKDSKNDYNKMLLLTMIHSFKFLYNYNPEDSLVYISKNYKELGSWELVDKIYQKNKNRSSYTLMYQSLRTYLIILQGTVVSPTIAAKYKDELVELENYY